MKSNLNILLSTVGIAGAALPATGFAQSSGSVVLAQMMQGEKGMQGKGMQGQGMQGQGMQGRGMQGQGMQGMGGPGGQPGPQGQMGPSMGSGMMMGPGAQGGPPLMQMMMQGRMGGVPSDYIEGRIAFLHAELKITEAQMPAWTEFANVLRANAKRVSDARAAQPQRTTTTAADRLDDHERWLSARLESARALKSAYAKLYAVLDENQKKMADEVILAYAGGRQQFH